AWPAAEQLKGALAYEPRQGGRAASPQGSAHGLPGGGPWEGGDGRFAGALASSVRCRDDLADVLGGARDRGDLPAQAGPERRPGPRRGELPVLPLAGPDGCARAAPLEEEHMSMVWWLVNAFWFHIGCDVLSGYYQVMPVLTELYMHMSPAHRDARWSPSRAPLDSAYLLELVIEAPLALLVLFLFWRRHPGRFLLEVCAASVQLAGTVMYYAPAVAKGETHCWLSWADRSCGSVWIVFPTLLVVRHVLGAGEKLKRS
ncbi:unnamed protein product, partial [Prorocentrum cordatum]